MQSIENYKSESLIRLLLQGPPGSGKSTLSHNFPKPYVLDIDVNLRGPLAFRKKRNLSLPIGYDRLDIDESGKEIPLNLRYTRANECLKLAQADSNIETIIIDSATGFTDILMAEVTRRNPSMKDGRQIWGVFFEYGKYFINGLTSMRKHIVLVVHEKIEVDAVDSALKYRIAWPGQLGDIMGAFFTDVWRCEVINLGLDKYKWQVRTMPEYRFSLKNGFELPAVFEFDWNIVQGKLLA